MFLFLSHFILSLLFFIIYIDIILTFLYISLFIFVFHIFPFAISLFPSFSAQFFRSIAFFFSLYLLFPSSFYKDIFLFIWLFFSFLFFLFYVSVLHFLHFIVFLHQFSIFSISLSFFVSYSSLLLPLSFSFLPYPSASILPSLPSCFACFLTFIPLHITFLDYFLNYLRSSRSFHKTTKSDNSFRYILSKNNTPCSFICRLFMRISYKHYISFNGICSNIHSSETKGSAQWFIQMIQSVMMLSYWSLKSRDCWIESFLPDVLQKLCIYRWLS